MASLTYTGIGKTYPGGVTAVRSFDLQITHGEFVILVGPSGCGKSTVLRMTAGLEEITAGELYIGDRLVNAVQPKDRDIAMVFQDYALYPHMTVYQNMAFSLKMRGLSRAEVRARVEETAAQMEISELLHRKPRALSGGQRQRVALGRAMVREPAVFLLDEPLSNLDAKLRTAMRAEITRLHQRLGGTFVFVAHDQTEAMTMGDRIVVMKDGLIQQADTPQTLYQKPCNLFVAGFIGSPQMNILPAVLRAQGEHLFAEVAGCRVDLPARPHSARSFVDREILLGVRPECILFCDDASAMSATVELCELLGAESYLHLDLCGNKVVARTAPCSLQRGTGLQVRIAGEGLHLFDPESERTVY